MVIVCCRYLDKAWIVILVWVDDAHTPNDTAIKDVSQNGLWCHGALGQQFELLCAHLGSLSGQSVLHLLPHI